MDRKDNISVILQTLFAVIGTLVGYPLLGNIFIVLAAPFVVYMIFKRNALYLPAIILHCTSETSIIFLVCFSVIIFSILNYKKISTNKHIKRLFWLLIVTMPLYVNLTYQKMTLDYLPWQHALMYTGYYLSFWSFIYGYIIADTFNWKTSKLLIGIIVLLFIISLLFNVRSSRVFSMVLYMGIPYGLFTLQHTNRKFLGIFIIGVSLIMLLGDRFLTFTEILTILLSTLVYLLWNTKKKRISRMIISLPAYIMIAIIMITSIQNYNNTNIDYTEYGDYEGDKTFNNLYNRALYKLYDDRAVFWLAAWEQISYIKPIMPKYDMPDLIVYRNNGSELDASSFGAHNTPLQLIRIFGFLMGIILIVCYIYMSCLSTKVLLCKSVDRRFIPLFITITSYVVIIFLTGMAAILPQFALFYFGTMGVSYNKSINIVK